MKYKNIDVFALLSKIITFTVYNIFIVFNVLCDTCQTGSDTWYKTLQQHVLRKIYLLENGSSAKE